MTIGYVTMIPLSSLKLFACFSLCLFCFTGCSSNSDSDDDIDRDMIINDKDNCPLIFNPDQEATIGEASQLGDACDDEDADMVVDARDNCPVVANLDQLDTDGNGVGDACESCGKARLVADILAGDDSSFPSQLTVLDGKLYFKTFFRNTGIRDMWVYDPGNAAAGVTRLDNEVLSSAGGLTALDGKLYFAGDSGTDGAELWAYDPNQSPESVTQLADIGPGSEDSEPSGFTALDGMLYFSAADSVHGRELWRYDPSSPQSGAILVADINPTSDGSNPTKFTTLNGRLYFNANSGPSGRALWVYDPVAGASQVADVLPEINMLPFGQPAPLDEKLYFRSWSPIDGGKLWSHDPANPNGGATFLADVSGIFTDDDPDDLVAFNGKLYFTISGDQVVGREIWMFDPANPAVGVTLAFDIDPGIGSGRDSVDDFIPADFNLAMVELDGKLYLNGQNGVEGHELMVLTDTNNTIEVALAADINPGEADGFPVHLVTLNDKLYFRADDGVHGQELWEFDPACQ